MSDLFTTRERKSDTHYSRRVKVNRSGNSITGGKEHASRNKGRGIRETVVVEEMSTMQQGKGEKRKEKWNRRSVDEIGASRDSGLSG